MKNIIVGFILAVSFLGCSSNDTIDNHVEPNLVVGKKFKNIVLNDQFEKAHTLRADTYKIIFAFSKDSAHTCNDFLKTKSPNYLQDNHAEFIADISAAPSLIRSFFILPGLKDFKHTVLLLDDKKVAAPYRAGLDTESIVVVYIINKTIQKIEFIKSAKELQKLIEDDSAISLIAPVINTILSH